MSLELLRNSKTAKLLVFFGLGSFILSGCNNNSGRSQELDEGFQKFLNSRSKEIREIVKKNHLEVNRQVELLNLNPYAAQKAEITSEVYEALKLDYEKDKGDTKLTVSDGVSAINESVSKISQNSWSGDFYDKYVEPELSKNIGNMPFSIQSLKNDND